MFKQFAVVCQLGTVTLPCCNNIWLLIKLWFTPLLEELLLIAWLDLLNQYHSVIWMWNTVRVWGTWAKLESCNAKWISNLFWSYLKSSLHERWSACMVQPAVSCQQFSRGNRVRNCLTVLWHFVGFCLYLLYRIIHSEQYSTLGEVVGPQLVEQTSNAESLSTQWLCLSAVRKRKESKEEQCMVCVKQKQAKPKICLFCLVS